MSEEWAQKVKCIDCGWGGTIAEAHDHKDCNEYLKRLPSVVKFKNSVSSEIQTILESVGDAQEPSSPTRREREFQINRRLSALTAELEEQGEYVTKLTEQLSHCHEEKRRLEVQAENSGRYLGSLLEELNIMTAERDQLKIQIQEMSSSSRGSGCRSKSDPANISFGFRSSSPSTSSPHGSPPSGAMVGSPPPQGTRGFLDGVKAYLGKV